MSAVDRRGLLLRLAALSATALAPLELRAADAQDPWAAAFAEARRTDPSLMGYDSAPLDGFRCDEVPIQGRLPAGLRGALFRTGPARHEVGGVRYHH